MNILLVYPKMSSTVMTMDYLMQLIGKKASYPPLGLLTVASLLPDVWEKRLIDLNVEPELPDEALLWADFVFIGAMNVQAPSAREVIAQCNAVGATIVAGGPLFTHEYAAFDGVDHFVLNEAEITLPEFLADVEAGTPKPVYTTTEFADIHKTPLPMWELVDLSDYAYAIVQYSRGCPYFCDFCDVTALFGRRPRTKTPEQVIAELEAFEDLSVVDLVFFADDNLIGNKKRVKTELLPALTEWRARKNPPVPFSTQLTINLADDDELMDGMLDAGFRYIFIGIETPEEEGLEACQKRQNTKRNLLDNIHSLQEAGFIVAGGFIFGFDTDTPETFQRQIDFIQETGIVIVTLNILKAPPGTELYDRMEREGRLIADFDFDENKTNLIPEMDIDTLYEGYEGVLRHVYSPRFVYERAMRFMDTYKGARIKRSIPANVSRRHIATLARMVLRLGILQEERRYFWKLMLWTYSNHPHRFATAFMYCGLMYQFRMMHQRFLASTREAAHAEFLELTRRHQRDPQAVMA